MAKYKLRAEARKMRTEGVSIGKIAEALSISKGTASVWCEDIALTEAQVKKLHVSMTLGGYRGRLKGSHLQRERKREKIRTYEMEGMEILGKLSERDLLLLGLGLHLGEGSKTENRVKFTNSNPLIIKLFILWVRSVFEIPSSRIYYRVMINEIHKHRETTVRKKWAKTLKVPLQQFKKTVFIRAKTKKVYENHETYLGTLVVTISKSSDLQYRVLGLMKGLLYKIGG